MDTETYVQELLAPTAEAARVLRLASTEQKNAALEALASRLESGGAGVIEANALDVAKGREHGLTDALIDRLTIDRE